MPLYQVIVLAIVQGLTEFLPISSTAHLYLTSWLLGWQAESLTFDIALHIGTLAAVVAYFFRDWIQIVAQGLGMSYGRDAELKLNRAMLWLLVIGTIPVGVAGLLFNKQAESTWRNPFVIGGMLIGVGVLMWFADRVGKRQRDLSTVNAGDAITIGVAQALAVVPGTSRSGITITAGMLRNLDRETSARFSFLLSTPAIAAAAAKALHELYKEGGIPADMRLAFAVGVSLSAVVGFVVIAFFLQYLKRNTLTAFVFYRIIFGIIVLALAFFRPPTG
jgi:undecaprenyl-diphosphatase